MAREQIIPCMSRLKFSIWLPLTSRTHNSEICCRNLPSIITCLIYGARSRGGRYEYVTHFADWNFSKIIFREPLCVSLFYTNPAVLPFVHRLRRILPKTPSRRRGEAFASKAHWSSNLPCYGTRDIVMKITAAEKVSLELWACREVGVMHAFVESRGALL